VGARVGVIGVGQGVDRCVSVKQSSLFRCETKTWRILTSHSHTQEARTRCNHNQVTEIRQGHDIAAVTDRCVAVKEKRWDGVLVRHSLAPLVPREHTERQAEKLVRVVVSQRSYAPRVLLAQLGPDNNLTWCCVCVCVCVYARARACVCVCARKHLHDRWPR
jgi:hypothetical protein